MLFNIIKDFINQILVIYLTLVFFSQNIINFLIEQYDFDCNGILCYVYLGIFQQIVMDLWVTFMSYFEDSCNKMYVYVKVC